MLKTENTHPFPSQNFFTLLKTPFPILKFNANYGIMEKNELKAGDIL